LNTLDQFKVGNNISINTADSRTQQDKFIPYEMGLTLSYVGYQNHDGLINFLHDNRHYIFNPFLLNYL